MSEASEIVAAQDVTLDLNDGDLVAGVVLIAKVVQPDGEVTVAIGSSDGMSWLEQLGLVTAAHGITNGSGYQRIDEDDD